MSDEKEKSFLLNEPFEFELGELHQVRLWGNEAPQVWLMAQPSHALPGLNKLFDDIQRSIRDREITKLYEKILNDVSRQVEQEAMIQYPVLGEGFELPRYSVPPSSADEVLKAIEGLRKQMEEAQQKAEKDFVDGLLEIDKRAYEQSAEAYKGLESLEPMFGFMPLNNHFAIGEGADGFVIWPIATSSGRKRGRLVVSKYKVELVKSLGRGRKFAQAVLKKEGGRNHGC